MEEVFKCPYCYSEFDNENQAIECRDDCLLSDPEPIKYFVKCSFCNKEFKNTNCDDAKKSCERHERTEHVDDVSKAILKKEAEHPQQKKLTI